MTSIKKFNRHPLYDKVIKLAHAGLKPYIIAKQLIMNRATVTSILRTNGFSYKIQHRNIRYFQTIDSYTKAYFLGFIAADGCLHSNGNNSHGLSITIHSKDRMLLEILKQELDSDCNIQHLTTKMTHNGLPKDHVRLAIFNTDLYNDIAQYGITSNKSLTMSNIISNIPKEFRSSFILGYFDGDGCVVHSNQMRIKKGKSYPSRGLNIQIRGTKSFLEGLAKELKLEYYNIIFDKTHSLRFSRKSEIIKFFNCYKYCNVFLTRKRDIFLEYMSHSSWNKFIQVQTISLPTFYNLNG